MGLQGLETSWELSWHHLHACEEQRLWEWQLLQGQVSCPIAGQEDLGELLGSCCDPCACHVPVALLCQSKGHPPKEPEVGAVESWKPLVPQCK